ncbi:hypothetical protein BDW67DRAFT_160930 [Aspergillus spinulosporus]
MLSLDVLLPSTLLRLCSLPTLPVISAGPSCNGIPLRAYLDLALVPLALEHASPHPLGENISYQPLCDICRLPCW